MYQHREQPLVEDYIESYEERKFIVQFEALKTFWEKLYFFFFSEIL